MENLTLTQNQALAAGAIAGGTLVTMLIISIVIGVLLIIANWKIFKKTGEPGWKSIIPIYNVYILFKISGMKNFFWITLILPFVLGIVSGIAGNASVVAVIAAIVCGIFELVVSIMLCVKLSKAFGKGDGYALGLIFLPNIFTLILGFGKAEYVGLKE